MGLTINEGESRGVPLFALTGEIDIYTVPQFLLEVDEAARDATALAVDLREVSLVDSSGLGALLRLAQTDGRWRPVVLVCRGRSMPELLELTKLAERFIVIGDIADLDPTLDRALGEQAGSAPRPYPTGTQTQRT